MKAAVIDRYGPPSVLKVREVPRPALKPDQVLVEVYASSVNPIDWKIRSGALKLLMGFRSPMISGYDRDFQRQLDMDPAWAFAGIGLGDAKRAFRLKN